MSNSMVDTSIPEDEAAAASSFAAAASAAAAAAAVAPTITRSDNRLSTELRPISVEHGLLNRADGSVQWTQGSSSVLAGVYGPVMLGGKDEKIDRAVVVVNFKAASGQANNLDIERGSYIRQCFEPLILLSASPRCKIQINVQVLRDGGSILSCALNAVSLALIDAGIQCTAVLSAVAIAARPQSNNTAGKNGAAASQKAAASTAASASAASSSSAAAAASGPRDYLLDPLSDEESTCPSLTLAFASTAPASVLFSLVESGTFDQAAYADATSIGKAAAQHVLQFMRMSLERRNNAA